MEKCFVQIFNVTFFIREIDKLQEELVDSESVLDSKRKVKIQNPQRQ